MKIQIKDYSFNKVTKTITFNGLTSIDLNSILLITNVTDNVIIYNFANNLMGGTVSGNVLTLTYDTSLMANSDSLQIFIEDGVSAATELTLTALKNLVQLIQTNTDKDDDVSRQMLQLLKPLGIITSASGRIAVDINAIGGTIATVTNITNLPTLANVTTLANQSNIGGLNALDQQYNIAHLAFAQGFRNVI
jgi:hypothetical protein